jgi:hypothetical protein
MVGSTIRTAIRAGLLVILTTGPHQLDEQVALTGVQVLNRPQPQSVGDGAPRAEVAAAAG